MSDSSREPPKNSFRRRKNNHKPAKTPRKVSMKTVKASAKDKYKVVTYSILVANDETEQLKDQMFEADSNGIFEGMYTFGTDERPPTDDEWEQFISEYPEVEEDEETA
jgi:hypothetical protein